MSLTLGLALLSFTLESRELGVSLVVERDCAAFFIFNTFILEASLGLVSVDRKAGQTLSFTKSLPGLVLVSICAVVLELRGSATNGAEPEGKSSEADPVPSGDPLETCLGFAASIKARRLFFLGLEMVGDRGSDGVEMRVVEEDRLAVLICSDSFCLVFLVDGRRDAELGDNDCDEDDVFALCRGVAGDDVCGVAGGTTDAFLLLFDCALAAIDSV